MAQEKPCQVGPDQGELGGPVQELESCLKGS